MRRWRHKCSSLSVIGHRSLPLNPLTTRSILVRTEMPHKHFHVSVFSQVSDGTPAGLRIVTAQTVSPQPPMDRSRDVIKFPEILHHLAQLRAQYAIETYNSPQIGTRNRCPAQIP
jgi:hypothetical protein